MITDFDVQPVLVGPTLYLRPLVAGDFKNLYAAASDPKIWEQHPQPNRYQQDVFESSFFNGALSSGSAFVIIDKATDCIIGSSRYYDWDKEKAEVAIGFTFLTRSHWGGKTNAEVKKLMLSHAFQWANVVWLHIGTDNWRSRKAAQKIGACFSHEERKEINGVVRHNAFYKILPDALGNLA